MLREPKLSPRLHSSILPTSEYKSTILNPHWTIWSHLRNAKGPTLFQMSLKYPEPDIRLRSAVWVLFFIVCHVWRKCFPRIHSWELCITATACLMSNRCWTLGRLWLPKVSNTPSSLECLTLWSIKLPQKLELNHKKVGRPAKQSSGCSCEFLYVQNTCWFYSCF